MFFNRLSQLAGKVYSRGAHIAGKIKNNAIVTVGKVKNTLHDISSFIERVQKVAPLATEIVDELTEFIPGAHVAKKAIKYGVAGLNTIGGISKKAHSIASGTEDFINNPSHRTFAELVR